VQALKGEEVLEGEPTTVMRSCNQRNRLYVVVEPTVYSRRGTRAVHSFSKKKEVQYNKEE
jgi:hypothetical protein